MIGGSNLNWYKDADFESYGETTASVSCPSDESLVGKAYRTVGLAADQPTPSWHDTYLRIDRQTGDEFNNALGRGDTQRVLAKGGTEGDGISINGASGNNYNYLTVTVACKT